MLHRTGKTLTVARTTRGVRVSSMGGINATVVTADVPIGLGPR